MKDSRQMTEDWLKKQIEDELFLEYGGYFTVDVRSYGAYNLYYAYIAGICRAGNIRAIERVSHDNDVEIRWDADNYRYEYLFEFDDAELEELEIPF